MKGLRGISRRSRGVGKGSDMARLYLVRHGHATAGFGDARDPGLDELGRTQARSIAERLAPLGPLPILTSPMRRARETAAPLAAKWQSEPVVERAVAELPTPSGVDAPQRAAWLRGLMAGSWRDVPRALAQWREGVLATLASLSGDAVVFTHFVAINVAVGAAQGVDRFTAFHPDYCSATILQSREGILEVLELGREANTKLN